MKANSLGSLRVRLVFLVFLAMVPSLALILYTAHVQRSITRGAARENLFRIASLAASDTSQVMEGAQQLLGGLAQSQEIRSGDSAACGTMMAKLLAIYPFYSTLGVASPEGKVICSAVPLTNSVSVADRSWFRQVRQNPELHRGRVSSRPFFRQSVDHVRLAHCGSRSPSIRRVCDAESKVSEQPH